MTSSESANAVIRWPHESVLYIFPAFELNAKPVVPCASLKRYFTPVSLENEYTDEMIAALHRLWWYVPPYKRPFSLWWAKSNELDGSSSWRLYRVVRILVVGDWPSHSIIFALTPMPTTNWFLCSAQSSSGRKNDGAGLSSMYDVYTLSSLKS